MGKFDDMAMGWANGAIGAGMGLVLGDINDKRQLRQQERLNEQQWRFNKRAAEFNSEQQYDMWLKTNYGAQKDQMKKAGLSPGLMYGMSGGGGATLGSSNASVSGGGAPAGGGEAMGMMRNSMDMALLKAQKENIEADTANKRAAAEKTSGVDTENVSADTANKVLSGVILKYAGKEAQETFEQVKSPNRGKEADVYGEELDARKGIANNVYMLWAEGKLAQKSNEEIEQLVVSNAKSRAERKNIEKTFELIEANIKGANLSNIISELEIEMQKTTGVDKNGPWFAKVLSRLFMGLGGWKTLDAMK